MTEKDKTPDPEQPRAAADAPYWRRSVLWEREQEIRQLIARGYSYEQIRRRLKLPITTRRLCDFCRRQLGIQSLSRRGTQTRKPAGAAGHTNAAEQGQKRHPSGLPIPTNEFDGLKFS